MAILSLQLPVILIMAALMIASLSSSPATAANPDLTVALGEMQQANYFAFAMLINMAPPDLIQPNITFLMPNDRILSGTNATQNSVTDFLLRHSVPWPLLFDHMDHFPTGSIIPTSTSGLVLNVINDGRQRFFFNNVRVVSPNICTKGASIRCHGIDAVLQPSLLSDNCPPAVVSHPPPPPPTVTSPPPPPPPWAAARNATRTLPLPSHPPQSVEVDTDNSPPKSGSHHLLMRNDAVAAVSFLVTMICCIL